MRSIFVLLILVMIGLNGKGQSVTALPDSVLSQCCLEVTLLNGNVTTVDWVFIQYITRDGTGTKLFVEYAPNFGGIQWETQIRIQDDFDEVLERSKFIMLPFTVGTTDYAINRNWISNIEENTTTGGTWIYGRFGTPTKRKFSAVEDYETLKNLLLACRPRAIVVAENGLYTEGDTVRMGGFLIENTTITTEGYNWQMKDTLSSVEFGLDYLTPETLDTTVYWGRRHGSLRQMVQLGRRYYYNSMRDTTGGLYSDLTHSWNAGDPFLQYQVFNPSAPTTGTAWFKVQKDNSFLNLSNDSTNPYYSLGWAVTNSTATLGASESGSGDPGNGVVMGAYGFGTTEYLFMKTKTVDAGTATAGQYLQLINSSSGEVDFATIDLSAYLEIADTAAMLAPYVTFGNLAGYPTGSGTADRSARWSATNTLAAGNFTDNGTKVQALLPFQFQTYTTAGLPTGVTGYHIYNTTINGPGWYQGSRWAYALESTFARGTSTYVPFFDANGQITQASTTGQNTRYYNAGSNLHILEVSSAIEAKGITGVNSGNADIVVSSATSAGGRWSFSASESTGTFSFFDALSVQFPVTIVKNAGNNRFRIQSTTTDLSASSLVTNTVGSTIESVGASIDALASSGQWRIINGSNIVSFSPTSTSPYFAITNGTQRGYIQATSLDGFRVGSNSNHPLVFLTNGTVRGQFSTAGFLGLNTTAPLQEIDVNGDAYIRDSTRLTTTPSHSSITGLLTRNTDGWVGLASLAGGLSYSGGVLTGANIYTTSDSIRGNRYVKMAANGAATTAIGYWPSFPNIGSYLNAQDYGLYISPANGEFATILKQGASQAYIYNNNFLIQTPNAELAVTGPSGSTKFLEARVYNAGGALIALRNDTIGVGIYAGSAGTTGYRFVNPNTQRPGTGSNIHVWDNGTPSFKEIKRDTTIYIDDADYDFSAAITTAQVGARYNRVIFWMTTTGGAGSDSEITLHTPDANLMQVEYLIHSVDEAGGFDNRIIFGTNNAVDSTNGLVTNYYPSAGQGVHIRTGLRSGVYKYRYSN